MMTLRLISSLLLVGLLAACKGPSTAGSNDEGPTGPQPPLPTAPLNLRGPQGQQIVLQAEVADEEPERAAGLMFRTELVSGTAMVFVFPEPQRLSFWMKNTLIPLDLLFFRGGSHVATVPWAKPHDETPLGPTEHADTVVEVPGGWAADNGVGSGWSLSLSPTTVAP